VPRLIYQEIDDTYRIVHIWKLLSGFSSVASSWLLGWQLVGWELALRDRGMRCMQTWSKSNDSLLGIKD
jgi:hypothetical protein